MLSILSKYYIDQKAEGANTKDQDLKGRNVIN